MHTVHASTMQAVASTLFEAMRELGFALWDAVASSKYQQHLSPAHRILHATSEFLVWMGFLGQEATDSAGST